MRKEIGGDNEPSMRDGATSVTSSWRSSAYLTVEEAAAARTSMFEVTADAKRALARLADTRVECSEQHKIITVEFEAVQCSVKKSL